MQKSRKMSQTQQFTEKSYSTAHFSAPYEFGNLYKILCFDPWHQKVRCELDIAQFTYLLFIHLFIYLFVPSHRRRMASQSVN